jgi:threonylcarbamoyladenosine tRNA methylthiotransferase CDKAL1
LLNSCTVKNPAEDHFKNYIEKAREKNKYLVLAGCVPQGAPSAQYIEVSFLKKINSCLESINSFLKSMV